MRLIKNQEIQIITFKQILFMCTVVCTIHLLTIALCVWCGTFILGMEIWFAFNTIPWGWSAVLFLRDIFSRSGKSQKNRFLSASNGHADVCRRHKSKYMELIVHQTWSGLWTRTIFRFAIGYRNGPQLIEVSKTIKNGRPRIDTDRV